MIRFNQSKRTSLLTRSALGLALALGVTGSSLMVSAPAFAAKAEKAPAAAKVKLSKTFMPVYSEAVKSWTDATARPDVVAAQATAKAANDAYAAAPTRSAQRTAKANLDTAQTGLKALLQPQITQYAGLVAATTVNDDKYQAGILGYQMGRFLIDQDLQRQGLQLQLDSGFVAPDMQPTFNYFVGTFAYAKGEFIPARTALLAATRGGYHQGAADTYLAETYFSQNDAAGGLASLRASIELAKKEGRVPDVGMFKRGLDVANKAMLADGALFFGSGLLNAEPSVENWQEAIAALRRVPRYDKFALIDVSRLMDRTNSYGTTSDYIEIIQYGTDLGLPKEVLKAIAAGQLAGKLNASDPTVADLKKLAEGRVRTDAATGLLRGYERDAALPTAKTATVIGAGDSFLSDGQPARAEEFYKLALTKAGVDTGLVLSRLGIAQYDQGKFAEARATFDRVTGPRQLLAAYWSAAAAAKLK